MGPRVGVPAAVRNPGFSGAEGSRRQEGVFRSITVQCRTIPAELASVLEEVGFPHTPPPDSGDTVPLTMNSWGQ